MRSGDVAVAAIQQADGVLKYRPVIIISLIPPFNDVLVCAVSTKLHHAVDGLDITITAADPDFTQSGLSAPSLIRTGFVATVPASEIRGVIGSISPTRFKTIINNLIRYLTGVGG